MDSHAEQPESDASAFVYVRDTLEFSRVVNLFDAVFAIAMTLLVLGIDIPDVPTEELAGALARQTPQFVAFAISFAVVAHIWWQHHKVLMMIQLLDSAMVAILLSMLGAVVLVPFATGLIASAHTAPVAVMVFIALFVALNILAALLIVRAHKADAWRWPVSDESYRWLLGMFGGGVMVLLIAFLLAIWYPVAGLAIMAASAVIAPLAERLTYTE